MKQFNDDILKEIQSLDYQTILKKADSNQIPYLQHVYRLHEVIFGEVCNSCPSLIKGYIDKLKSFKMKKEEKENLTGHKLKNGAVIRVGGKPYSNHNLTDDIAVKFLKDNPNRKQLFVKFPDEKNESVEDIVLFNQHAMSINEAKEILKTIGVNSKASTVEGIQKKLASLSEEEVKALTELLETGSEEE